MRPEVGGSILPSIQIKETSEREDLGASKWEETLEKQKGVNENKQKSKTELKTEVKEHWLSERRMIHPVSNTSKK